MVTNSSQRSQQKKVHTSETGLSQLGFGQRQEAIKKQKEEEEAKKSLDFLQKTAASEKAKSTDFLMTQKLVKTNLLDGSKVTRSVKDIQFPVEINVRVMDKLKLKQTGTHKNAFCSRVRVCGTSTLGYTHNGLNYSYNYRMKHGDPFMKKIEE